MARRLFREERARSSELEQLIDKARNHKTTEEEVEEQRISFVAGNLALHRPEESLDAIKARVRRSAKAAPLRERVSDDFGGR